MLGSQSSMIYNRRPHRFVLIEGTVPLAALQLITGQRQKQQEACANLSSHCLPIPASMGYQNKTKHC
jgi:hypothetical protein